MDRRELLDTMIVLVCGAVIGGLPGYFAGRERGESAGDEKARDRFQEGIERGKRRAGGVDPTTNDEQVRNASVDTTLDPGEHHSISLDVDEDTLLLYSFSSDRHVDAMFMDSEDYEGYENGGQASGRLLFTREDTTEGLVRRVVSEGSYVLVLDNTAEYGEADPSGAVTVSIRLEAYQLE